MPGEHRDAIPGSTIPNSDRLVVRGGELRSTFSTRANEVPIKNTAYNPRHFVMKLDGSDVIHMAMQCEQTSSILRSQVYAVI